MKHALTVLILLNCCLMEAQTTITAAYSATTVTFSTGVTYITFAVRNNNSYAVTLTNMTCLQANLYENNSYTLWFSPTSLSGAPVVASPTWIQVATSLAPISSSVIVQQTPFNCIGLTIPAFTTYRFALQGSKGTAVRGAVTPNIFSASGVDLLVGDNASTGGQVGYFGWQNIGNSGVPYFFDGSITFAPANAFTDLQVQRIIKPSTVCSATSSAVFARVCNKSPQTVNFASYNANVNFVVNSGSGILTSNVLINSGSLGPCGCVDVALPGANLSSSGTYTICATVSPISGTDYDPTNNTSCDDITNYRPIVTPSSDSVCQYTSGPLFSGFTGSSCQYRERTATVNCVLPPVPPVDGSSDATAGLFASSALPGLPPGAIITGGKLLITNLNGQATSSFGNEARFSIYSPAGGPGAPFVPGVPGSPLNFAVYNFDYSVDITPAQLNAMYTSIGAGGNFTIGYWETFDDVIGGSDLQLNAQTYPTQVTMTIDYTIPPNVKWYLSPSTGSSFYTGSNFNPFTTPGSGLSNTNTTGIWTYYAACAADTTCRIPVTLKIKPSPAAFQDSLESCENIAGTGYGSFDISSLTGSVSGGNPLAQVSFFVDFNLSLPITTPASFSSITDYVYSKVEVDGCYASDTVYLLVHPTPQFVSNLVSGALCAPDFFDVANLIDPFSISPPGTDTFYFSDPAYSVAHPNPHMVLSSDTVYMVFKTNTIPSCADSAEAILTIFPVNNYLVNQDTVLNYSNPGVIGCNNLLLVDGLQDTLNSPNDCSIIASIKDLPNGNSLGNTSVCEEIDNGIQNHNGQPYVIRHYEITPTNNDSAIVCLYFLDDDLDQYNNYVATSWPNLPTIANPTLTYNFCVTQVDNGNLNTPGHIPTVIPHTAITSSFDTTTTIWTLCFKVDSFSHFYLHSQNPNNIALSTDLISFTGKNVQQKNRLKWVTASETNNSHFVVERSKDGKVYAELSPAIPTKAPKGNSQQELHYQFGDEHPLAGANYYRLKQVDIDGKLHQSKEIRLDVESLTRVSMYPNPVKSILNVEIQTARASKGRIHINDAVGRTVRTVELKLESGNNQTEINLDALADGIYSVTVSASNEVIHTERLYKK